MSIGWDRQDGRRLNLPWSAADEVIDLVGSLDGDLASYLSDELDNTIGEDEAKQIYDLLVAAAIGSQAVESDGMGRQLNEPMDVLAVGAKPLGDLTPANVGQQIFLDQIKEFFAPPYVPENDLTPENIASQMD